MNKNQGQFAIMKVEAQRGCPDGTIRAFVFLEGPYIEGATRKGRPQGDGVLLLRSAVAPLRHVLDHMRLRVFTGFFDRGQFTRLGIAPDFEALAHERTSMAALDNNAN